MGFERSSAFSFSFFSLCSSSAYIQRANSCSYVSSFFLSFLFFKHRARKKNECGGKTLLAWTMGQWEVASSDNPILSFALVHSALSCCSSVLTLIQEYRFIAVVSSLFFFLPAGYIREHVEMRRKIKNVRADTHGRRGGLNEQK